MRRVVIMVTIFMLAPLLMGAGGLNPPSGTTRIVGPSFYAMVTLDPHMAFGDLFGSVFFDVTTSAKVGSIRLLEPPRKATGHKPPPPRETLSQADFKALPDFTLFRGCDLGPVPPENIPRTELRFLYTESNQTTVGAWLPPAQLQFLFRPLGVAVTDTNTPVITQIISAECVVDPRNPGPIFDGGDGSESTPGILLMEVVIQFLVPAP